MRVRRLAVLAAAALLAGAAAATPEGRWEGQADVAGMPLPLVIDLGREADGRWIGSVTLPGRGVKGAPLADVALDARGARFTLAAAFPAPADAPPAVALQWRGAARAEGTLSLNGLVAPLALQRSGPAQVDRPLGSTPIDEALAGRWVGRYELGGLAREVTLTLGRGPAGLAEGTLVIVGRRRTELALDRVRQGRDFVELRAGTADIAIEGRWDGASIDALFTQGPFEAPLVLRRAQAAP